MIQFGANGKPRRFNEIIASMFPLIPKEIIYDVSEGGEQDQGLARLRTNLRPNKCTAIILSKDVPPTIEKNIPFNRVEDIELFRYLRNHEGTTAEEIRKSVYSNKLSDYTVRERLLSYENVNLISSEYQKKQSPKKIYYLKQ